MVGPINNGFQQQPPIANTFRPGEQQSGLSKNVAQDTVTKSNDAPNPNLNVNLTPPDKTDEINSKLALSRDAARESPNNLGNSSNRGTVLDISV